jgi:hypothetical protein
MKEEIRLCGPIDNLESYIDRLRQKGYEVKVDPPLSFSDAKIGVVRNGALYVNDSVYRVLARLVDGGFDRYTVE